MKTDNSTDRVTQHLRALVEGRPPRARLPSVRAMTRELRVSPVTVQRALDCLAREGLLEARPGQGTFVAGQVRPDAAPADLGWQSVALGPGRPLAGALGSLCLVPPDHARALNAGYLPEELQPTPLLAVAAARATRRPGVWARMPIEGLPALRAWFAAATGGAYQAHEVTICPGTQAANAAAFRALASPGDPVLVESPTYLGALAAARAAGLRVVPVPTDTDGVRPDMLAEAFQRTGARLAYCQPTYANPSGAVLSTERRTAVLAAAAEAGAFLIEDDWARDFRLDGEAPPPLATADRDGHVVYVRSLTKCAAPGLRVGAICARGAALERLRAARLVDDFFVPGILQETALQLLTASSWPCHLRALQAALRERRDEMAAALRTRLGAACLPHVPTGGLHLWVRLPDGVSDLDVEQRAASQGILVSAGRHWHPAEPPAPFLRLSFAAARPDWIEDCIARLASVVRAVAGPGEQ
ncbi:MAG: PLP-dependent aminotransferase family protein [Acetobacteraceae bacterium]|nr:PLP-dependent aminotransferase family protein [Acetobacteraceae bacterium]